MDTEFDEKLLEAEVDKVIAEHDRFEEYYRKRLAEDKQGTPEHPPRPEPESDGRG